MSFSNTLHPKLVLPCTIGKQKENLLSGNNNASSDHYYYNNQQPKWGLTRIFEDIMSVTLGLLQFEGSGSVFIERAAVLGYDTSAE